MGRRASGDYDAEERFDLYHSALIELMQRRLIHTGGLTFGLSFRYGRTQGLSVSHSNLDEEDFRSFLLTFRRFVSANDPVYVCWIRNAVRQRLRSDVLTQRLDACFDAWRKPSGTMVLIVDGQQVEPTVVLDYWINGHYFHVDKRKAESIRALEGIGLLLNRSVLMNYVLDTMNFCMEVGNVLHISRTQSLLD